MCEWLIQKGRIYEYNSQYSKSINEYEKALQILTDNGEEQLVTRVKLRKAVTLIKDGFVKEATDILSDIEPKYK